MEELREIARAHYRAGSPEVQALAYDFFKSLDTNNDGIVEVHEFLAFMRQEGHSQMYNAHFFRELDRDHNGNLDFWEVMTLYYIIKSGRPFCNGCGEFIHGIFFSCVKCFHRTEGPFTLCRNCYMSKDCPHNHDGKVQFLDNYTLLESKRTSIMNQNHEPNSTTTTNQSGTLMVAASINTPPSTSNSNAIVVGASSSMNKWKAAFKTFEMGLSLGNIGTTLCTIL